MNGQRVAPVREGDELDVRIEAVGGKGDGIAKTQGFVLFVSNTKAGDEVRVRVTKVLKSAGFAEVIGKSTAPIVAATSRPTVNERSKKEEEELAALEKAAEVNDSEDFGDDSGEEEAEALTEKVEEPDEEEKPQ